MIYFETNVTTTDNPNMYSNSSTGSDRTGSIKNNGESQPQYPDYPYQANSQQYQQHMPQSTPVIPQRTQASSQLYQQHMPQSTPVIPLRTDNSWVPDPNGKFTSLDISILKQLLPTGEKYKWKEITKEINKRSHERRKSPEGKPGLKNVSPTFVTKQYQSMLGLPNNTMYFGTVGSSLPYIVAENGWDDIEDKEGVLGRNIE